MLQHSWQTRLILVGHLLAFAMVLAACGDAKTFTVNGEVMGSPLNDRNKCAFPDATYHVGDQVVLRGADSTILSTDQLRLGDTSAGTELMCDLDFTLDNVPAGEAAYQITVGSVGPIVVTEEQLRDEKTFSLAPRTSLDMLRGETAEMTVRGSAS